MELEFFCKPDTDLEWFQYWRTYCHDWLTRTLHPVTAGTGRAFPPRGSRVPVLPPPRKGSHQPPSLFAGVWGILLPVTAFWIS
jgi:hypothetical protein